jgi:hypothetical protein
MYVKIISTGQKEPHAFIANDMGTARDIMEQIIGGGFKRVRMVRSSAKEYDEATERSVKEIKSWKNRPMRQPK